METIGNNRRLGRFHLDDLLLQEVDADILVNFFSSYIVPLKADYRYDLRAIEYLVWAECLPEIDCGKEAPLYGICYTYQEDSEGVVTLENLHLTPGSPLNTQCIISCKSEAD